MDGVRPLSDTEQEIRARLNAGDYAGGFELLMPHFQNKVFRLTYSLLGDPAWAEETAQGIFVRIWKSLAGYRGQSSLSTWIYSIARNTCLTALSSGAARRRTVSIEGPGVQRLAEARSSSPQPQETGIDLPLLLAQLPENYRAVITLFYMEDRSYEEVSRLLGLPLGTVKTYLHRARKQLAAAAIESRIEKGAR